jgi:hypothetical protein
VSLGPTSDSAEGAYEIPWVVLPAWGSLVHLSPLLLAQPLARQCLLRATLLSRLHVITVLLDFLDDVFLLHFAFETAQRIFQRLTFLNAYFSQLEFTRLPMHAAMIAVYHNYYTCFERSHLIRQLIGTNF